MKSGIALGSLTLLYSVDSFTEADPGSGLSVIALCNSK